MAEANHTLHLAKLRASMALAAITLARRQAIKEVKRQLAAQGLRPSDFSHRDLVSRAEVYLAEHRAELFAEAKSIVEQWAREGFFGKRAVHTTTEVWTVRNRKDRKQWTIHLSRQSLRQLQIEQFAAPTPSFARESI
jgi:hypothetical protein